jgi:hypothetical protein
MNMKVIENNLTGLPVLVYTCPILGRVERKTADCPALYLTQAVRTAETGPDAVLIAEGRFRRAKRLRAERLRKWQRERRHDREIRAGLLVTL